MVEHLSSQWGTSATRMDKSVIKAFILPCCWGLATAQPRTSKNKYSKLFWDTLYETTAWLKNVVAHECQSGIRISSGITALCPYIDFSTSNRSCFSWKIENNWCWNSRKWLRHEIDLWSGRNHKWGKIFFLYNLFFSKCDHIVPIISHTCHNKNICSTRKTFSWTKEKIVRLKNVHLL